MRNREDTFEMLRRGSFDLFQEKWGVDTASATKLAKDDTFRRILDHLEKAWMETLVEENDHDTLLRNQGSVRAIRDLLGLQSDIDKLNDLPPDESSAFRRASGDVE